MKLSSILENNLNSYIEHEKNKIQLAKNLENFSEEEMVDNRSYILNQLQIPEYEDIGEIWNMILTYKEQILTIIDTK